MNILFTSKSKFASEVTSLKAYVLVCSRVTARCFISLPIRLTRGHLRLHARVQCTSEKVRTTSRVSCADSITERADESKSKVTITTFCDYYFFKFRHVHDTLTVIIEYNRYISIHVMVSSLLYNHDTISNSIATRIWTVKLSATPGPRVDSFSSSSKNSRSCSGSSNLRSAYRPPASRSVFVLGVC